MGCAATVVPRTVRELSMIRVTAGDLDGRKGAGSVVVATIRRVGPIIREMRRETGLAWRVRPTPSELARGLP
jgi:hypothetical protein